jgi:hypothetical protein
MSYTRRFPTILVIQCTVVLWKDAPKNLVEFQFQNTRTSLTDHCNTGQMYCNVLLSCTGLKGDTVTLLTAWLTQELQVTSLLSINPVGEKSKFANKIPYYTFLLPSDVAASTINSFRTVCLSWATVSLLKFISIIKLRVTFCWPSHFCFLFRNS